MNCRSTDIINKLKKNQIYQNGLFFVYLHLSYSIYTETNFILISVCLPVVLKDQLVSAIYGKARKQFSVKCFLLVLCVHEVIIGDWKKKLAAAQKLLLRCLSACRGKREPFSIPPPIYEKHMEVNNSLYSSHACMKEVGKVSLESLHPFTL